MREVVAPSTLVTALLFFLGWSHAFWFFDYFGVNSTSLGLTTQDYLMRSQDAMLLPLLYGGCFLAVFLLWRKVLYTRFMGRTSRRSRRRWSAAVGAAGLLVAAVALTNSVRPTPLRSVVGLGGLAVVLGVLLILAALHLLRADPSDPLHAGLRLSVGEWCVTFVLIGVGLFWAVADYAAAVGTTRAIEQVEGLSDLPGVAVMSETDLALAGPGVTETSCGVDGEETTFRYRYDGLKLVLQSGNQYFLLPVEWNRDTGVAFLLPRTATIRLDYFPAGASVSTGCRPA